MNKLNNQKFLDIINQKWINKNCPMCGHNNWNFDGNIVSPMTMGDSGNIQLGGQIMPLVAMTCMHCGNVIFVNPLIIGAFENEGMDK